MKKQIKRLKILSVLLASVCLFSHVSMIADASGTAGTTSSASITYNKAEDGLWRGNSYIDDEMNYYDYLQNIEDDIYHSDSYTNEYWYLGKRVTLFNTSASYYGYKITFTLKTNTRTNYDSNYCHRAYWLVGNATDLYNGQNASGNIGSTSFTAWVTTNNSVETIHLAPYFKFTAYDWYDADDSNTVHSNYYDIYNVFTVSYTGYKTVSEYNSALNSIQSELEQQTTELGDINSGIGDLNTGIGDLNSDLNTGIGNLQNGFNSSAGQSANSQLSDSLSGYSDAENNLFTSAKTGLDDFRFADLTTIPALVSAMGLVSSMMSSAFIAIGGADGLSALVLSVLFSIMLVSMAIGLYHFYQSKKGD